MKQIHFTTVESISADASLFLAAVNKARKEYGESKKEKAPTTIDSLLASTRLLFDRDGEHGILALELYYEKEGGIPCVRNFPNFGLDVNPTKSSVNLQGDRIVINIDVIVKAGKAKWQIEEIKECANVFNNAKFGVRITYTLDETTDWAGYSADISTDCDVQMHHGHRFNHHFNNVIPGEKFKAVCS